MSCEKDKAHGYKHDLDMLIISSHTKCMLHILRELVVERKSICLRHSYLYLLDIISKDVLTSFPSLHFTVHFLDWLVLQGGL